MSCFDQEKIQEQYNSILESKITSHISCWNTVITLDKEFKTYGFCFAPLQVKLNDILSGALVVVAIIATTPKHEVLHSLVPLQTK